MNVKDFSKTIVLAEAVGFVLGPETRMDAGFWPLHRPDPKPTSAFIALI
jgi:hypothetical protein